ncbi:hypothetical protein BX616_007025 [Lobosporangium transversale]|uniref:Ricin B lectin domain-containing protein n=1 Tax=Lobosporangium transversale TaxID=64571 RepID=A0A1Y2GGW6_9FUNG|nr:hypothetical protein BCR41DRAFT_423734 [Lobosporangium transversale]KAF9915039.1 hypothetical protein BX616_007025 [Lobosporangium transversale]ORZ10585.1 hypothetical protein BCR41DRAFT_423734 [Lobosporangium transversale]|eukprot:XP_021879306.1 hypothetical protein BCR41DRAFT_423734 [Lobosporangium transversale]
MYPLVGFLVMSLLFMLEQALAVSIPNGNYRIQQGNRYLSAGKYKSDSIAFLLPGDDEWEQIWRVENESDGTVTITSPDTGRFLTLGQGIAQPHAYVMFSRFWQTWKLEPGSDSGLYAIAYPGGPVHGNTLAIDLSPNDRSTNRLHLEVVNSESSHAKWSFERMHGDGKLSSCGPERSQPLFRVQKV